MDLVGELNNEDTKKKFQVFKNVFFDSKAIAAFAYFVTRNTRLSLPF